MTAAVIRATAAALIRRRTGSARAKSQKEASVAPQRNGDGTAAEWRDHTRVFLQPIAAPSILGLFGFAAATFMVAAYLAGWYGGKATPEFLFPFCATFGGLAQFMAGMWAYRARDALATAMHGMWGAFWIAFGILYLLVATGDITAPTGTWPEFGYWFLVLGAITGAGAVASLAHNLGLTAVLVPLSVGSILLAVHYLIGGIGWQHTAGWVLVASAIVAFYVATAMLLKATSGRVVLPLGELEKDANVPGSRFTHVVEYEHGEPGVKQGQ
jgi:succinate-acetate transporter protein